MQEQRPSALFFVKLILAVLQFQGRESDTLVCLLKGHLEALELSVLGTIIVSLLNFFMGLYFLCQLTSVARKQLQTYPSQLLLVLTSLIFLDKFA